MIFNGLCENPTPLGLSKNNKWANLFHDYSFIDKKSSSSFLNTNGPISYNNPIIDEQPKIYKL